MILPGEYEQARAIAEALLHLHSALTQELFAGIIDRATTTLPDIERRRLYDEMEAKFNVFVGESRMLTDNTDHIEWLLNTRSEIDWRFWNRYKEYLQREKGMPPAAIKSTDDLTDAILGSLENPKRPGAWDRRGVVVGQVQSGKTANYTGLICKAADAGYRLIIILAGIHNSLRSQTQIRLDEGFIGRDTNQFRIFHTDSPKIGVGKLPGDNPAAIPLTTSHEMGDFKKRTAESMSLPTGTIPLILVVKKNAGILRNLLAWVRNNIAEKQDDRRVVPGNIPLLLLDDEADNASINTKKLVRNAEGGFEEVQELTRINSLIRRLLNTFERKAYVGYTATPFANIFIPPVATKEEGRDLFPESFIVNLRPPSNYIGPVQVFGLDSADTDGSDGMPIVRQIVDADSIFPVGHKMDLADNLTELTGSLHEAIRAFVLVSAARRARGQINVHNSMLIHVTRYIKVQNAVVHLVSDTLEDLQQRIRYENGTTTTTSVREELRELWERDFIPTTEEIRSEFLPEDRTLKPLSWEEVEPHLFAAADKIKVKEINGHATDALEYYDNQSHGLSVIAVGGDKLSRGLTLEGLSVSYYLRTTYMYDTLMQMGRWFGYRPGYADLCRLYTSPELEDWYRHITMASEELRNEFDAMWRLDLTPKDFGLKVQMHPGALMVTSADKARYGQKIRMSYMGQLIESYAIAKDNESIQSNLRATTSLLEKIDTYTVPECQTVERSELPQALVWRNVRPAHIAEFLTSLRSAPDTRGRAPAHASVPGRQAEFILKKVRQRSELTTWTVVLCSSSTGIPSEIAGRSVGLIRRTPADGAKPEDPIYYIRKNHIIDPTHEALDLTEEEFQKALEDHQQTKPDATRPNGISARKIRPRSRGLLLLYPLDPTIPEKKNKKGETSQLFSPDDDRRDSRVPIIGFALSFPGFGDRDNPDDAIEYLANSIFIENELHEDVTEDEVDEDDE